MQNRRCCSSATAALLVRQLEEAAGASCCRLQPQANVETMTGFKGQPGLLLYNPRHCSYLLWNLKKNRSLYMAVNMRNIFHQRNLVLHVFTVKVFLRFKQHLASRLPPNNPSRLRLLREYVLVFATSEDSLRGFKIKLELDR